jgi:hypothetical protein
MFPDFACPDATGQYLRGYWTFCATIGEKIMAGGHIGHLDHLG